MLPPGQQRALFKGQGYCSPSKSVNCKLLFCCVFERGEKQFPTANNSLLLHFYVLIFFLLMLVYILVLPVAVVVFAVVAVVPLWDYR